MWTVRNDVSIVTAHIWVKLVATYFPRAALAASLKTGALRILLPHEQQEQDMQAAPKSEIAVLKK